MSGWVGSYQGSYFGNYFGVSSSEVIPPGPTPTLGDITWSDVTGVDPTLVTGVSAMYKALILDFINTRVNPDMFKGTESSTFRLARIFLACHFAQFPKASRSGGNRGPVVSQSEGGVSQSFAVTAMMTASALGSTEGGRAYQFLVQSSPAKVGFVT